LGSQQVAILYTKGHSAESSIPSLLNASVDYYASKSQHICPYLHHAPLPTFFMDRFTFFTPTDGWIESNIQSLTDCLLSTQTAHELGLKHGLLLVQFVYDPTPPPTYMPYPVIWHLFSFTHAQDSFPQRHVSTPWNSQKVSVRKWLRAPTVSQSITVPH